MTDDFLDRLMELGTRADARAFAAARDRLLDTVGVTVAGAADAIESLARIRNQLQARGGAAFAVGLDGGFDPLGAALANGISAHQLELDDGHRFGMVHPGATVIAALMAMATIDDIDGQDLLRGIIVGYEAAIRTAMAMQPGLKQRGFHATGPCGTIGAAMGLSEALDLDRDQRRCALAAAASLASGLLEVIRDGSDLKPFNAGQAAMNGVLAVIMARAGYSAPKDVIGGRQGLLQAFSDSASPEKLLDIDPHHPLIEGVYVKPYAACRHCHAPIELALRLREKHALQTDDIAAVEVQTYGLAVNLHDHRRVENSADARMSTPFSVAAALATGEAGMESFSESRLDDPTIQRIMARVSVTENPGMSERVPRERGAHMSVTLGDGRRLVDEVSLPLGEPERPVGAEALREKFQEMVAFAGWSPDRSKSAIHAIDNLESDVRPLLDCLWPLQSHTGAT
ncbi:MAG: MmgE/PrpD family protein [Wenzhouxiangella sp.]